MSFFCTICCNFASSYEKKQSKQWKNRNVTVISTTSTASMS